MVGLTGYGLDIWNLRKSPVCTVCLAVAVAAILRTGRNELHGYACTNGH